MNFAAVLPESGPKPTYYKAYIGYVRSILEFNKIQCVLRGSASGTSFVVDLQGKRIVFDFSDFYPINEGNLNSSAYFKFHYSSDLHEKYKNMFPFPPVSFHDWGRFFSLRNQIRYCCNNNLVLCMQEPRKRALERRGAVQSRLILSLGGSVDVRFKLPQEEYWKKINNCLVHVFIPGARNNMLDRGHFQYLGLGCCTISPIIRDELPYYRALESGVHYIHCDDNYENLLGKIEWCKANRQECIRIGENAKKLFSDTSTPEKVWEWIRRCINI